MAKSEAPWLPGQGAEPRIMGDTGAEWNPEDTREKLLLLVDTWMTFDDFKQVYGR